jgi:hypothetical protein
MDDRYFEFATEAIAKRLPQLTADTRVRLVGELAQIIEETVARWIRAERHNLELPGDCDRRRAREMVDVPRRLR